MAELTQIHSTKSPNAISIVFVHGLGGDARQTWMYTPKDDATLWPKWVGEDADKNPGGTSMCSKTAELEGPSVN